MEERLIIPIIWVISALFNLLKIMHSYSEDWRKDNTGVLIIAFGLGPIFTIIAFVRTFIIHKWK